MAETQTPAGGKAKGLPVWAYALGGGVVLLLLLSNRGSGSGGGSDAGAVASLGDDLKQTSAAFDQKLKLAIDSAEEKSAARDAATRNLLTNTLAQIAGQIAQLRQPTPAPTAPSGPTAPPVSQPQTPPAAPGSVLLGPRPSDSEIEEWARGINLPASWGYAFVGRFGILPRNIPELEEWRRIIGVFNGRQWCIGGECI